MRKFKTVLYWILVVLVGGLFVSSGYPKIVGGEAMIQRFGAWGYGVGFMRVIGILELVAGLLLSVPKLSHYAATLLSVIMLGATYTHLSTSIGGPEFALGVLILLVGILLLQKDKILRLFKKG